jgi:hypothetical protein
VSFSLQRPLFLPLAETKLRVDTASRLVPVVMDKGEIAEFDTPSNLYKDENGLFRGMLDKSGLKWEDLVAAEEQRLADDASIV